MRNLYWMREMEAASDSRELKLLRPARFDATALCEIMRSREIGVPSFVIAGLLIPLGATVWRLVTGFTFDRWWVAALVGIGGVAIGLGLSWSCSAAARSRRTGSSSRPGRRSRRSGEDIGHCGRPPKDRSRTFAVVAISVTIGVWVVLPALVALALAT